MNLNVLIYKIRKRYYQIFGEKLYESYKDALKDCISLGYENDMIIKFVQNKARKARKLSTNTQSVHHLSNTNLLSLIAIINLLINKNKVLNIIDFGGGDGGHYLSIRPLIKQSIVINWHVIETPAMVEVLREFETDELHFASNINQVVKSLTHIDIVYTSGTLQYTSDAIMYLKEICNIDAPYKIFNRQSLNNNGNDLISIQKSLLSWHGSSDIIENFRDCEIRYPHTNLSVSHFENIIQEKHKILFTYEDNSGLKQVNKENIIGKSYCVEKYK